MTKSIARTISIAILTASITLTSASNPECSAHPNCGRLEGDCCPTTDFRFLACCEEDSLPTSDAECSANTVCAERGLEGACCPTPDGIYLYCCNDVSSLLDGSSGGNGEPTPNLTPAPTLPPTTSGPTNPPSTSAPTAQPVPGPTPPPTTSPSPAPTRSPTKTPTKAPTPVPAPGSTPPPTVVTSAPTKAPTPPPTPQPTPGPTNPPTPQPTPGPTQPPTPSPTPVPTPGATQSALDFVGDQLWDYYQLDECQGDCDFHSDCALGLVCGFRDYEGDKSVIPTVEVFGCSLDPRDFGTGFEDFCHRPERADTVVIVADKEGDLGKAYPLGLCEGDCYDDSDCTGNLICIELEDDQELRGCTGVAEGDYGYCIIP